VPGMASWNFAADQAVDEIELAGTTGTLHWPCFAHGRVTLRRGDSTDTFDCPAPRHVQLPLIRQIITHLQGGPPAPSTGHTAWRTSQVMDTVLATYYRGREDAFWLRDDWQAAARAAGSSQ